MSLLVPVQATDGDVAPFTPLVTNNASLCGHGCHRRPGTAAGTLGTLLSVLLVCSFGLAPGQSNRTLGVEILATGAAVATQAIWVSVGKRSEGDPLSWTLGNLPILLFPALAFVGGGCSLLAGSGGGLYWILAGTVLTFIGASVNTWVLLVEILR